MNNRAIIGLDNDGLAFHRIVSTCLLSSSGVSFSCTA